MALDARLMPPTATPDRQVRSSASTPSLRSRDGSVPLLSRMDGGGNVRVVVRVRAFLQRGEPIQKHSILSVFHLRAAGVLLTAGFR